MTFSKLLRMAALPIDVEVIAPLCGGDQFDEIGSSVPNRLVGQG